METRKIQQTGGSTYIISLPKQWADKVGIEPGIRVGVQPQTNGTLLICPDTNTKPLRKKTLDITNVFGNPLEREFIAAYLAGYDIIEFVSAKISSEQKKILRTVCYKLIGPEIIEENATSVLIQDLLSPSDLPIKKAVQRMALITSSMFNDCMLSLYNCDTDLATDLVERDDEVDRLYLVIAKQFKSILCGNSFIDSSQSPIESYHDLRMAATPIERIADHCQRIAQVVLQFHPKLDSKRINEIKKLSELASETFKKSIEALYDSNSKLANQMIENQKTMNELIAQFNRDHFEKTKDSPLETLIAMRTVVDSIGRITDYAANIAETAINASIETQ